MIWHGVAKLRIIIPDIANRPEVMGLPVREKKEFVEQVEGGCRGLVDACNYYQLCSVVNKYDRPVKKREWYLLYSFSPHVLGI